MRCTSRTASASVARTFTLLSLLTVATMAQIQQPRRDHIPQQVHKRANAVYQGCYSNAASMETAGTYMYQSSGYCSTECEKQNSPSMALTNGNECYCGDEIPADSDKVDDTKCNTPCYGFGSTNCGGDGFFSVFLTNGDSGVPIAGGGSSSSSGSSTKTTATPSVVTNISPGQTLVVTITPSSKPDSSSTSSASGGGGGSNTAGIAAGAVVGVLAIAGIVGGLFFWIRHKRRKEAEEEYKKRTQVSDFMRGAHERKPPSTGYSHMSDTRLDPESGARRNSVGSLADNQDYSRRILRVANPDSS